jgi:hypothetical protein
LLADNSDATPLVEKVTVPPELDVVVLIVIFVKLSTDTMVAFAPKVTPPTPVSVIPGTRPRVEDMPVISELVPEERSPVICVRDTPVF